MSVYLLGGARTASGTFLGSLSGVTAPQLGAVAIKGAIKRAGIDGSSIDEVFMGNVVSAGVGQAPARQAVLFADLDQSIPATTVNKVCGSGLKTIITGAQTIKAEDNSLVIAGGMESMSCGPHLLPGVRNGVKFGDSQMLDAILHDGLWDVYSKQPMGNCAEECVKKFGFTREDQDRFAIESFKRAQKAIDDGIFTTEIEPVTIKGRKGDTVVDYDEGPHKANFDKIPKLRPAFSSDGTITAANASTLNDGAAAVVLGGEKYKDQAKFKIISYASHAQHPTDFTTAPIGAMKKAVALAGVEIGNIELFEINEAFAVVTMAAMREFDLSHERVNIYGGGVSLGHPIGCSGTRIVVTLMNAMDRQQATLGMAAICIGGGEALSLIIERI
ncbi:MAG: thiolase family protein [Bdellovibrionales bacterium]|jgi:acetyl-CoA C-acetyltransferase|nr:thiolase family protein [Bdellovibrionales bacterium]MBT3527308.1 thiolase family protein [Bdellovibrionales bacterium]MBT7669327.1 thiolase family protein [Bdellovibrionales bacterium]MBT7767035.1 thiolase family protein [Bdellovibrionales bacterium]